MATNTSYVYLFVYFAKIYQLVIVEIWIFNFLLITYLTNIP